MSSYTPEITRAIISRYKKFPTSNTIFLLAERFKKSTHSIRAKHVSLGIYNRPDLLTAFYRGPFCIVSNGYMATQDDSTIRVVAADGKIFLFQE